jgi:hypothetical protein
VPGVISCNAVSTKENILMPVRLLIVLALCLSSAAAQSVHAYDGPMRVRNPAPVALLYGLPRMAGGGLLGQGHELSFASEIANNFGSDVHGTDAISFDGETAVFSYGYRRALNEHVEWFVEIPYVVHFGGFLDGTVDGFHDLLGISDRGRNDVPRNRLDYRVLDADGVYADIRSRTRRLGDVRVGVGYRLAANEDRALAGRIQLKLPTGRANALTGSEGADLAFWLDYTDRRLLQRFAMAVNAGGGILILGDGELMPDRQRRTAWVGQLGLSYPLSDHVAARVQLDGHQRLFSTGLRQLGSNAVFGTFGLRWQVYPRLWADVLIIEHLRSETTSDVAFQLMLGARL